VKHGFSFPTPNSSLSKLGQSASPSLANVGQENFAVSDSGSRVQNRRLETCHRGGLFVYSCSAALVWGPFIDVDWVVLLCCFRNNQEETGSDRYKTRL